MISGSGHWSAFLDFQNNWVLWYGPQEIWFAIANSKEIEKVKTVVDLLNKDDSQDSILTRLLCVGFALDGPV